VSVEGFCRPLPCPSSPETVAIIVATPLERRLGKIADASEITAQSGFGRTRLVSVLS